MTPEQIDTLKILSEVPFPKSKEQRENLMLNLQAALGITLGEIGLLQDAIRKMNMDLMLYSMRPVGGVC